MDELSLDGKLVVDLKVRELKEELRKRGLSKQGNKQELFQRLTEYLLANPEGDDEGEDEEQCLANRDSAVERSRAVSFGILGDADERTATLARLLLASGVPVHVWTNDQVSIDLADTGVTRLADQKTLVEEVDLLLVSGTSERELRSRLGAVIRSVRPTAPKRLKGICVFCRLTEEESGHLAQMLKPKNILYLECSWVGPTHQAMAFSLSLIACGDARLFQQFKPLVEAAYGSSTFLSDRLGRLSAHVAKAGHAARQDFPFVIKILNDDLRVGKRQPHKDGFLEYCCFLCDTSRTGATPRTAKHNFIKHLYDVHQPEILEEVVRAQVAIEVRLDELQGDLGATNRVVEGLQGDLGATNRAVEGLKGDLGATNRVVEGLQGDLGATNRVVEGLQGDLGATNRVVEGLKGDLDATNRAVTANNSDVTHVNNDVQRMKFQHRRLSLLVHSLMEELKGKELIANHGETEVGSGHCRADKKALESPLTKASKDISGQKNITLRGQPFKYRPIPVGSFIKKLHIRKKISDMNREAAEAQGSSTILAPYQPLHTGLHCKGAVFNTLIREREALALSALHQEVSYPGERAGQFGTKGETSSNANSDDGEVVAAALILNSMRLRN